MSLVLVVIVLIAIGFLLWALETKMPWMDATIKRIIEIVIIVVVVIWLLQLFGVWGAIMGVKVGGARLLYLIA
jgi:hypothetical protein